MWKKKELISMSKSVDVLLDRERTAKKCVCCAGASLRKSPAILMPFISDRVFGWAPVEIDKSWGLQTIPNGIAYTVCNSLLCSDCGLLFLDIRFNEKELTYLYQDYRGEEYTKLRDKYEPGYSEKNIELISGVPHISAVENFLTPIVHFPLSILDWGGDTGKNSPFKSKNELLHVYDISDKNAVEGVEIVSKEKAATFSYNLIVCSNVLEHVPYPEDILLDIANFMNEDTLLYIEVPFEDLMKTSVGDLSVVARKKHWHEHINFYSEKSLLKLIERCGLKLVKNNILDAVHVANASSVIQFACKLS